MPTAIYLDPLIAGASVVRVGGQCYSMVGPSNTPPDTHSIDAAFRRLPLLRG